MRILSVDYGTKRIGLATADEFGLAVRGVKTLPSYGIKRDAHRLVEYANNLNAQAIIVGMPLRMAGDVGPSAQRVQKLVTQLSKLTPLPITLWDERLTTEEANQWMIEHGIKPRQRQSLRDQIAACLILEDYLASRRDHDQPY